MERPFLAAALLGLMSLLASLPVPWAARAGEVPVQIEAAPDPVATELFELSGLEAMLVTFEQQVVAGVDRAPVELGAAERRGLYEAARRAYTPEILIPDVLARFQAGIEPDRGPRVLEFARSEFALRLTELEAQGNAPDALARSVGQLGPAP